MNINRAFKDLVIFLLATVIAMAGSPVIAAEAPPAAGIADLYVCNYNSGKDRADLLAARDYYVRQAARANIELGVSVLFDSYKGDGTADFVWMSVYPSLAAFGASEAAAEAAPAMASVQARFDSVASCTSNLGTIRGIFQGPQEVNADPGFMSASACTARDTMSAGDVADLRGHISEVLGNHSSFKNVFAFSIQPMTTGPNSPDVFLLGAHDNVAGWSKRTTELGATPEGQSLRRHFDKTLDCDLSLWRSERVIGERAPAGS